MAGVIVLAAYRPSKELFARQLASIRDQTVSDWECIISVDGEHEAVEDVVADVAAGDDRFRILADGRRLGFYLNFERGLAAVPADADWVALSDQDDFWYPNKLELLLPHLADSAIVSGQARLVAHPGDEVLGFTERRQLDTASTMIVNQFTGSLCIFRADLLSTALPFPRLSSHTVAHDHWLAVVGMARGGGRIVDDVVQDYVQHSSNVFGDPSRLQLGPLATLRRAWDNAVGFTRRYEGSSTPAAMARMLFWIYVGWRQLMAQTLLAREPVSAEAIETDRRFGSGRRLGETVGMLRRIRRARVVPAPFVIAYLASWVAGWVVRGRRRRPTASS
jgi:glycosyltransferase involved in cell wall biosynthesis